MKKWQLLMWIVLIAVNSFSANLVLNPSFEEDANSNGRPDSWGDDADYVRSSEQATSGTYSVKGSGFNNIGGISQTVTIQTNTEYVLSVKIYYASGTGIVVFDTSDKFDTQYNTQATLYAPNGGWLPYIYGFNSGTNTSVTLRTYTSKLTNGVFYIDDVSLEKATADVGPVSFFELFTHNMVLQRNEPVAVYGRASATQTVTVTFATQTKITTTDTNGVWSVALDPMEASFTPRTLTASTVEGTVSVTNVLVGDVWLAGGQSNMDHPFNTYNQISSAGKSNSNIRLLIGAKKTAATPQEIPVLDLAHGKSWQPCTEAYLSAFSPVAYYFGAKLQTNLNIPIGLIESAWGGTIAEAWTPAAKMTELGYTLSASGTNVTDPAALYNGMIHPFRKFTFKGVIWYQGESNSERAMAYNTLFSGLIQSWRAAFGRGDLPFYYVQLAPYGNVNSALLEGATYAWLRDAQTKTLSVTNTGMAVITDAGEYLDIHPQNKQPVGERLALFALRDAGVSVNPNSPIYREMQISGREITVSFDHAATGLRTQPVVMNKNKNYALGADPEAYVLSTNSVAGFKICGTNRVFVAADAVIAGNQVIVSSPSVPRPVAVRYGWENFPLCNLFSTNGLPVTPFRTDTFDPRAIGEIYNNNTNEYGAAGQINSTTSESTVISTNIGGIAGYLIRPNAGASSRYGYYRTADTALKNGLTPYQIVSVLYYDQGTGSFSMKYDATSGPWTNSTLSVDLTDSREWRVVTTLITNAYFGDRCNGYDIRLVDPEKP